MSSHLRVLVRFYEDKDPKGTIYRGGDAIRYIEKSVTKPLPRPLTWDKIAHFWEYGRRSGLIFPKLHADIFVWRVARNNKETKYHKLCSAASKVVHYPSGEVEKRQQVGFSFKVKLPDRVFQGFDPNEGRAFPPPRPNRAAPEQPRNRIDEILFQGADQLQVELNEIEREQERRHFEARRQQLRGLDNNF